jgi:hypothetical protein
MPAVCLVLGGLAAPAFADDKSVTVQVGTDRKAVWLKSRATTWDSEHKTWVQRGGYTAYRVPDEKFTMYFGPEHMFRINTLPYRMLNGEPQYQYNGYWMTVVDPWPESWAENWYDTDDVFVRYDNGYYLYNTKAPDFGLSLRFAKP